MSRVVPTKQQMIAGIRRRLAEGEDPHSLWLTVTEVSVLVDFHRRTLQRFVDEAVIAAERRGPTNRIAISFAEVKRMFPQDTRAI